MRILKKYISVTLIILILIGLGGCNTINKAVHNKEQSPTSDLIKLDKLPIFDENFPGGGNVKLDQVDLRQTDLSQIDLYDKGKDLFYAFFDSNTKWPDKKKMPKAFNPQKILEDGKNPGLEIKSIHKEGIMGTNIGLAIIDNPLRSRHEEYSDRIKHYEEMFNPRVDSLMHGPAVASIAAGRNVGVAPNADLYYFAVNNAYVDRSGNLRTDFEYVAKGIERVIEFNEGLPKDKKIRVVSMSMGCEPEEKGYKEFMEAVKRAKEKNIFVISTALYYTDGFKFNGLGRVPNGDPNSLSSYTLGKFYQGSLDKKTPEEFTVRDKNYLYFPMDSRTAAGPNSDNEYIFYRYGAYSWVIPYISGLYALACEANPNVTPELFWENALETSKPIKVEYKSKIFEIKHVVNPKELIEMVKNIK